MGRPLWVLALVSACGPPTPSEVDTDRSTDTDTPDTSVGSGVDCDDIPSVATSVNPLDDPRGYHDVAFDTAGHLLGSDGVSLLAVDHDGGVEVFLPAVGVVQGMDWLPNGDLVYANDLGNVTRVDTTGAPSVLAVTGGTRPYGVTVGPDGLVYVATWDTIERYDPVTGSRTTILFDPDVKPYVLDFSPDHRTMYVGTIWNGGAIWALDLDADLRPTGPPTLFATIGTGEKQLHDGLAVDWCGNLVVVEFYTNDLYRVTPDGEVSVLADFTADTYGHGLEWGSGIGGWRSDALYLPQPYNDNHVMEVVIGVPAREWTGTVWPPG